ncbi:response regulator transcription factor [Faecalispora anaeroviscerum]|uniref:response regulator transcription factor n=1 Tax=Faecalispora anaeroviscerum TaxID=2991836 RepID=UPI0024B923F8|nr:response regulator transcription factor [Faecalispora anaeroviscerum]
MYRVFLVEDEQLIREGIKRLVEWEEYGFKFVGEAADGELAWPLIQKEKPDIVITDIRMPFLDGLSLSRLIKKELPDTLIIILSGYDDFNYAKKAIEIGVSQYLLKPLSKDQLVEVLQELKKKKDKIMQSEQYHAQFSKEVQEYLSSSRRSLFDLLVSGKTSIPQILERAEKIGINLSAMTYNLVLLTLEEDLLHSNYTACSANIQEQIEQIFSEESDIIPFGAGIEMTAFLIKADGDGIAEATLRCASALEQICRSAEQAPRWTVVTGEPVPRLSSIPECYHLARKKLYRTLLPSPAGTEAHSQPESVLDFNPNELDASKMDQQIIRKFLTNGVLEDADAFTEDYFNSFGSTGLNSTLFRHYVLLNIQFTASAFWDSLGQEGLSPTRFPQLQQKLETAISSLANMQSYVAELFRETIRYRDSVVTDRYRETMLKVLDYIDEHYSDPEIGLNMVARVANVSATHFSTIFSQQTGKTFVEYLTESRMKKARELLRCTGKSSSEIARTIGYNDPHYFSFLFKKVNGQSPRDYRNGKGEKSCFSPDSDVPTTGSR